MQSFTELNLSAPLLRAIEELGYTAPSPIQAQALPQLLGESTDFLGLAATGTGKTAAFSIPLLERIDPKTRAVQALVLCPTRELALQVAGQIDLLGKHLGIRALPIYGGAPYEPQIRGLRQGATVVVGTPGRVIDHLEQGTIKLDQLKTLVLDEADEMISMGFREDLETILKGAPRESANIWLFSATMSKEVRKVADTYLRSPKQAQVNRTEMVPTSIEQLYYLTHESNKPEILCKLIDAADEFYGLVFCQTKTLVVDLTQYLNDRGYKTDCLHGDMNQNQREKTMRAFRERKTKLLVCTDVAARGLDVQDITHVINYSIPRELDNYVHRIGRTARSGKTGIAMSLVSPMHRYLLGRIEQMTKSRMTEGKIPSRREIAVKKVSRMLPRLQEQNQFARAVELLDDSFKEALAQMTPEEVAGRFLSLSFPEVFSDKAMAKMSRSDQPAASHAASTRAAPARREARGEDGPRRRFNDDQPLPPPRPLSAEEREARKARPEAGPAVREQYREPRRPFAERGPRPFDREARSPYRESRPVTGESRPFKRDSRPFNREERAPFRETRKPYRETPSHDRVEARSPYREARKPFREARGPKQDRFEGGASTRDKAAALRQRLREKASPPPPVDESSSFAVFQDDANKPLNRKARRALQFANRAAQ